MNAAVHKFSTTERPAPTPPPAIAFATFDSDRTAELLNASRNSVSMAELLLDFVHGNRDIARQAGIETIVIEIFAAMQGDSFSGVINEIEEAARNGQSLKISHRGLATLRRIETLVAEASTNMRKFVDGDFSVMGLTTDVAQANPSKSSDLSALIPFAIFGAIVVAVVVLVTRGE